MSVRQRRQPKPFYWVEEKSALTGFALAKLMLGVLECWVSDRLEQRVLALLLLQTIDDGHLWLAWTGHGDRDLHLRCDRTGSRVVQQVEAIGQAQRWVRAPAAPRVLGCEIAR